jgi:tRNA 2-thiouridine synthesizing protein B
MATLHVVSHSPFSDGRLNSCLRVLGSQDGLLLCGDAVHGLQRGSAAWEKLQRAATHGQLYALQEDVSARAIQLDPQVKPVDYPGFVQLSLNFDKVNTWL